MTWYPGTAGHYILTPNTGPTPHNFTQNISLKKKKPTVTRKYKQLSQATSNTFLLLLRYAFQAFGQGPRACIGMRFALLEAKVAVISVLRKYSFKPGTRTTEPLVIDAEYELGWVEGGLWAKVEPREDY